MRVAEKIISLMDLTSLSETDSLQSTKALCHKAVTPVGSVAAVCVYPQFVKSATFFLKHTTVVIATVVNFPQGTHLIKNVVQEINQAILDGATEIDVVYPYLIHLEGEKTRAMDFVRQCKQACGPNVLLKVILETGALPDLAHVEELSETAIEAGADFLKTSTGKTSIGATLAAVERMLTIIKSSSKMVGLKISGGVRTLNSAREYIDLADSIMGNTFLGKKTFRFGASHLLDACLDNLK